MRNTLKNQTFKGHWQGLDEDHKCFCDVCFATLSICKSACLHLERKALSWGGECGGSTKQLIYIYSTLGVYPDWPSAHKTLVVIGESENTEYIVFIIRMSLPSCVWN